MAKKEKISFPTKFLSNRHYLNEVPVEGKKTPKFNFTIGYYDLYAAQIIRLSNCLTLLSNKFTITEDTFWNANHFEDLAKYIFWTFNQGFLHKLRGGVQTQKLSILQHCHKILTENPIPYGEPIPETADEELKWCYVKLDSLKGEPKFNRMYSFAQENRQAFLLAVEKRMVDLIAPLLTLGTFLLYIEATHQSKTAQKSADAAVAAENETQRSNNISARNYELAEKEFASSEKSSSANFKLSEQSLSSQIKAFKESQHQFTVSSESVLGISDIKVDSSNGGAHLRFLFDISNFKDVPVEILHEQSYSTFSETPPTVKEIKAVFMEGKKLNRGHSPHIYITKGNPYKKTTTNPLLSINKWIELSQGPLYIYTYGFIRYKDLMVNRLRDYWYILQTKPLPNGDIYHDFILNENFYTNEKTRFSY
ncbi:MAG TPA: hypothetical protein VL832_14380 [Puia sp.]|jgi:hypothetical protein|nr:hypothetical protein [Puia sp.]